jgi:hypothetical protein
MEKEFTFSSPSDRSSSLKLPDNYFKNFQFERPSNTLESVAAQPQASALQVPPTYFETLKIMPLRPKFRLFRIVVAAASVAVVAIGVLALFFQPQWSTKQEALTNLSQVSSEELLVYLEQKMQPQDFYHLDDPFFNQIQLDNLTEADKYLEENLYDFSEDELYNN